MGRDTVRNNRRYASFVHVCKYMITSDSCPLSGETHEALNMRRYTSRMHLLALNLKHHCLELILDKVSASYCTTCCIKSAMSTLSYGTEEVEV